MLDAHRLLRGNPQNGPVFAARNGKAVSLNNVLGRLIMPAVRKANLEHLWHGWYAARRGLGSNLYSLGVSDKTIQAILRQANVNTTTSYYIKSAPADAVAAMARLEGVFPELGNKWATTQSASQASAAVN